MYVEGTVLLYMAASSPRLAAGAADARSRARPAMSGWSTSHCDAWSIATWCLLRAAIPPALRGKGWSDARAFAATQLRKNPNSYFYRHVAPDQVQVRARARGGATRTLGSGSSASQDGVWQGTAGLAGRGTT